jgi:hypothetical protein
MGFGMGLGDFTENPGDDPEKTIRERIPDNQVSLALEINDAVEDVVGEGNYRVKGSGGGVTYYPNHTDYARYAFITVQPNRGSSYLYIHFDTSAKKCVKASPIPSSSIKSAQEIPSNWNWSRSFRLSIEIERGSDIDESVYEAIEQSFNQLKH